MQHYLWPLLRPRSVALIGASERPRSLGRTVYENLLAGAFQGDLYAVNPRHKTVLERPAYASLAAIGAPVDLAIIATPPHAVVSVLDSAADANVKVAVVMTAPAGIDTAELRAHGFTKIDLGQGLLPHAAGGFRTPSGRLELRADALAERGIDPLPHYHPPAEVGDAALAARLPLALVTPKTHLFLNSTFANQARQAGAQPHPYVVIHPDDANARNIRDGAMVLLYNDRGDCVLPALGSDDARPGVVVAPMGWWGEPKAQATTSQRLTRLASAPTFNDNRIELAPAE